MSLRSPHWFGSIGFSLSLLGIAGCSSDPTVIGVAPSVWISPSSAAIPLGDSLELRVFEEPQDNRDAVQDISDRVLSWQVEDEAVLVVRGGFVTGLAEGRTRITAEIVDRTPPTANVTILPPQPRSLRIAPREMRLRPGEANRFTAFLGFASGDEVEVPGSSVDRWSSSDPNVVSVDGGGNVLALLSQDDDPAEVLITARRDDLLPATAVVSVDTSRLVAVDVEPAAVVLDEGEMRTLRAVCRYSDGRVENCTSRAQWACLDEGVCTCDGGTLTAHGEGRTRCIASLDSSGLTGEALVEVGDCDLLSVRLSPENQAVALGSTTEIFATAVYGCDHEENITERVNLWSYDPAGVAMVDAAGIVFGLSVGATEVTATFQGVSSAPATLTVIEAQPVRIDCVPESSTVEIGEDVCFDATLVRTNGSEVLVDGSWAVLNPTIATPVAGAPHCFSGLSAGTTRVRVGAPGVPVAQGECTLEVLGPNACVVTPVATNMLIGETLEFEVMLEGTNKERSPLPDGVTPTWSVSSTQTLSLLGPGVVEARATGNTSVEASAVLGGFRRICRPANVFVAERCAVFPGNFENGIQPWSATNGVWEVGVPTAGPGGCFDGSTCAATTLNGNATASSGLQSPFITLCTVQPGQVIELWYWQWFSISGRGQVWWAGLDGNWNWIPGSVAGNSGGWGFASKDLTAARGQQIQVGFWHGTFGGTYGWAIDRVEIVRY